MIVPLIAGPVPFFPVFPSKVPPALTPVGLAVAYTGDASEYTPREYTWISARATGTPVA